VIAPRNRIFLWVGLVFAGSWLTLAFFDPDSIFGISETVSLGYYFGTLFGHVTVAAAWAAYGPGRLLWRVLLSLAWVALLGTALLINIKVNAGPPLSAALVVGGSCFAQWVVLQLPLWGLKVGFRSHLSYINDEVELSTAKWQFGIRQLLIFTTIVAIVFGIGRLTVGTLVSLFEGSDGLLFLFLAGSAIVFSLPLLMAALLRRWTVAGVLIVLVLIGLGTVCEASLLQTISRAGGRPNIYDFLVINTFTSVLVLIVATVVRLNGYALSRTQPS
jgi:hypothetical protein